MATEAWITFEARMREIEDLSATLSLLGWDEQTYCSRKGRAARAQHSATLATLVHERTVDPVFGDAIETLAADGAELSEAERAMVRLAKHDRDRSVKLPAELVRALRQQASRSNEAWERARVAKDFSDLAARAGGDARAQDPARRGARRRRRPVRRAARRVRAGDDGRGARSAARGPARRPGAVRPAGARPAEARHVVPGRPVRQGAPGAADAAAAARLRVRLRGGAPGHLDASVLRRPRPAGRADDDALLRLARAGRAAVVDARVRPRPLRAGHAGGVRPHRRGPRAVARPARVAVAVLGERRRPVAPVLVALPAGRAGVLPGASRAASAWTTSCAASTPSRRAPSASTPTR